MAHQIPAGVASCVKVLRCCTASKWRATLSLVVKHRWFWSQESEWDTDWIDNAFVQGGGLENAGVRDGYALGQFCLFVRMIANERIETMRAMISRLRSSASPLTNHCSARYESTTCC